MPKNNSWDLVLSFHHVGTWEFNGGHQIWQEIPLLSCQPPYYTFKNLGERAGEMAQWSKQLLLLWGTEVQVPEPHVAHNHLQLQFQRIQHPLWPCGHPAHMRCTYKIHRQTRIHIKHQILLKCLNRAWWCTPLKPALGRWRQADLCEF